MNLDQIIDIDVLQEIQDKFSDATGLSAITVDFRGVPVTKYSNFTSFCQIMRKTKEYEERCNRCDAFGGIESARRNSPYVYQCHAGLADFAIPIKVQGQFVGSVLAGQAKMDATDLKQLDKIIADFTDWKNEEELRVAYEQLPVTSLEKVQAGATLLQSIISNLIEKNIIEYVQNGIDKQHQELLEEIKLQKQMEKDWKEKERTALQPRINVNFLQHSLNTASRLSILENADNTTETLFDIIDILQYTIKQSNHLVTLEEEVAQIRRYLNLQQTRFGNRFQYDVDIPRILMNEKVPSLILQAIVDNALVHGLETKSGKAYLHITADSTQEDLIIKILDNGIGIPNNILEDIQLDQYEKTNDSINRKTGLDLSTVKMILKHHYGNDFKMTITSHLNKGTSVMFMLPKESR